MTHFPGGSTQAWKNEGRQRGPDPSHPQLLLRSLSPLNLLWAWRGFWRSRASVPPAPSHDGCARSLPITLPAPISPPPPFSFQGILKQIQTLYHFTHKELLTKKDKDFFPQHGHSIILLPGKITKNSLYDLTPCSGFPDCLKNVLTSCVVGMGIPHKVCTLRMVDMSLHLLAALPSPSKLLTLSEQKWECPHPSQEQGLQSPGLCRESLLLAQPLPLVWAAWVQPQQGLFSCPGAKLWSGQRRAVCGPLCLWALLQPWERVDAD